jgi:hypothetical protein
MAGDSAPLSAGYPQRWRSRPGGRGHGDALEESPDSEGQGAGEIPGGGDLADRATESRPPRER